MAIKTEDSLVNRFTKRKNDVPQKQFFISGKNRKFTRTREIHLE